ncbi:MAG TPA: crossover junction endodeoxyribonuclease RuvC [Thermoanaerobaculia bacterium]|nr:crossover junction endodeoxyribonuclease RuvC [Thermoanaerobaculia bacterium]
MRVLGLDPGSRFTGYGCIELRGGGRCALLDQGRISLPPGASLAGRLAILTTEIEALVARLAPEVAVLEQPFSGVNTRSLIVLAQARGALLAALARHGLAIEEYSPAEVKSAVTGNGRAGKEQVARMVALLLGGGGAPIPHDASDALAVALCYAARRPLLRAVSPLNGAK